MFSTIHGRKIWYTDTGKGFPVILIHGYLESSEIWNNFSQTLSGEYRVIAVDLPGHGRSEVYSETHTMEMIAGIVRELIEKLNLQKVVMVGHSLGGYVTLAFLELFPEYLAGYCLFHSHPLADSHEVREKRKKDIATVMAGKKDLIFPDSIEKMYAAINLDIMKEEVKYSKKIASMTPGNGIIALLNGMMKRPSRVNIMEEGRVPCLWFLGTMDNHIPYGAIQEKVKLPSNASIVTLRKSGHMGFVEDEEMSSTALIEFLKSLQAGSGI